MSHIHFPIFFLFLLFSSNASAQLAVNKKPIKTGLVIGIHHSDIRPLTLSFVQQNIGDKIGAVSERDALGVHAGAVFLMELDNRFALRGNVILSYQRNEIHFDLIMEEDHTETVQPVLLEFPLHLVYTGDRDRKIVPSVSMGFNYLRDVTFYKNQKLSLERHDVGLEIGSGFLFGFKKHKIHPELLVSFQGVGNDEQFASDVYNKAVRGIGRGQIYFRVSVYK